MSDVTIRRAGPADAQALCETSRITFTQTFGHLYPPSDLATFLASSYSLEGARRDLADPAVAVWLAEAEGRAVGHALVGPCHLPHPEVTPACGQLERIYLEEAWRGGGTGGRLMDLALAWLEKDGPRPIWIGVWSQNLRAQALYYRFGFEKVGEYDFPVGETLDHEFILRRG